MFGLTDYIIVIVINNLSAADKKTTNWFDQASTIKNAAACTISNDTTGNPHSQSNVQKQAFNFEQVETIRDAYGLTGTNFATHLPYRNGELMLLDDKVNRKDEITLIKIGLDVGEAIKLANIHRILPERTGS